MKRTTKVLAVLFVVLFGASACEQIRPEPDKMPPSADKGPQFADARTAQSFKIEMFAKLDRADPPLFDPFNPEGPGQQYAFYDMKLSDGSDGLPAGIYSTTGPFPLERSSRILHVDKSRKIKVYAEGFQGSNAIVLGGGKLKTNGGFLVTEPVTSSIRYVSREPSAQFATLSKFRRRGPRSLSEVVHPADADNGAVRPTGLAVGRDIFAEGPNSRRLVLYMTDFNMGDSWSRQTAKILRIPLAEDGALRVTESPGIVAEIPVPRLPGVPDSSIAGVSSAKALFFDDGGLFANGQPALLAATFSIPSLDLTDQPPGKLDNIYAITPGSQGPNVTAIAKGFDGTMFPAMAPAGSAFANGLYVPTLGTPSKAPNGGIFTVAPGGRTTTFIENVNATSVVFDSKGVLGVADSMYFATFDPYQPGVIWQVSPR
jgi:hypothetical protein